MKDPAGYTWDNGVAFDLARRFHEAYERLAPSFGYETRTETRRFDPESANGKLMIAVCAELAAAPQGAQPVQTREIEDCPELNLSNYDAEDVARLNDWAVRADALLGGLAPVPLGSSLHPVMQDALAPFIRPAAASPADAAPVPQEVERDAQRYRWLKMTAPPGQPFDLFQRMLEAKRLVDAYNLFCTSWTQWDEVIDAAMNAGLTIPVKEQP